MAGQADPFTPGEDGDPTAGLGASTYDNLVNQWTGFLADPRGRAALLSGGLTMLQPHGFAQSDLGQFAQAVGSAGESARTTEALDLKQQEAASKEELRSAQAGAAEARAGSREQAANIAEQRLGLAREREKGLTERNTLSRKVQLSGLYQRYVTDVAKRNAEAQFNNPKAIPEPVLPMGDWVRANPMLKNLGLVGEGDTGDTGGDTSGDTGTAPPAPTDPSVRKPNTYYQTPKGRLKWTGTGWVQ